MDEKKKASANQVSLVLRVAAKLFKLLLKSRAQFLLAQAAKVARIANLSAFDERANFLGASRDLRSRPADRAPILW